MENQKKGLLVASFGTAHPQTRDRNIRALEEQVQEAFPERKFYRCCTSPTVRRLMEQREGIRVDGPAETLEKMYADGMEDILVFATHVIPGIEYDRLTFRTDEFRAAHPEVRIRLTKPLLWQEQDYRECAEIMVEEYGRYLYTPEPAAGIRGEPEKNALLFFGHGTPHANDVCYERLEKALRLAMKKKYCGAEGRIFVVTVEGGRTAADVLPELVAEDVKKVYLIPFLLTAGEHVMHDMAGDEDNSAKSLLRRANIEAVPVTKGLGEYEKIRSCYVRRVRRMCSGS